MIIKLFAVTAVLTAFIASLAAFIKGSAQPEDHVYDVWANPGLHLMMSDNGTPDDFDDDFVIDWETNREVAVFVLDK